jgi:1-acyl-sn-glycerol-3-phosphate acyltransferase
MRKVLFYMYFFFLVTPYVIGIIIIDIFSKNKSNGYALLTHYFFKILYSISLIKIDNVKLIEEELNNSSIIVTNHNSKIDPSIFFYITKQPLKFVAKNTLSNHKIFWFIFNKFCIYVDKDRQKISLSSYKKLNTAIDSGYKIIFYPEGKRIKHNNFIPEKLDVKNGAFKIANQNNCTLTFIKTINLENALKSFYQPNKVVFKFWKLDSRNIELDKSIFVENY